MTSRRGSASNAGRAAARLATRVAPALALTACAGGAPLLYPAKTLPKGEVRAVAGLSGEALVSNFATALQSALNEAGTDSTQPTDVTFTKGALVAAAVTPGIAPFFAVRVGVGNDFEGGLTYTGRSAGIDMRRAFYFGSDKSWAVSLGLRGTAALYGALDGGNLAGVNLSDLKGYGAEVPLLVGYEASSGLYMVWFGARGGWEHDTIGTLTTEPGPGLEVPPLGLTADRYWAGGVVGAAIGFRHLHAAVELDASYETITGSFAGTSATVQGATIVPAAALWWDF
jgi:hypothetical protein